MKEYTFSEARQCLSSLLDRVVETPVLAKEEGDGQNVILQPEVKLDLQTACFKHGE